MRIAIDVMGGDNAPDAILAGSLVVSGLSMVRLGPARRRARAAPDDDAGGTL